MQSMPVNSPHSCYQINPSLLWKPRESVSRHIAGSNPTPVGSADSLLQPRCHLAPHVDHSFLRIPPSASATPVLATLFFGHKYLVQLCSTPPYFVRMTSSQHNPADTRNPGVCSGIGSPGCEGIPPAASPCGLCGPTTQVFSRRTARLLRVGQSPATPSAPATDGMRFRWPQVDSGHSAPAPGASMCQCMCGVTRQSL